MKVYIVEEWDYEEYSRHGVFSTKEKALEYVNKAKSRFWPHPPLTDWDIEEIEVDEASQ